MMQFYNTLLQCTLYMKTNVRPVKTMSAVNTQHLAPLPGFHKLVNFGEKIFHNILARQLRETRFIFQSFCGYLHETSLCMFVYYMLYEPALLRQL